MKVYAQNRLRPSQVLFAFDDVATSDLTAVRWAVAYATRQGCRRLVQRLTSRIGSRVWEMSEKRFVLSVDYGLTEPEALEFLVQLPRSTVRIASPDVLTNAGLMPRGAFHPKLYLFDADGGTSFIVGSANLTESALVSNTEVVAAGRAAGDEGLEETWTAVQESSVPLTNALLDQYRAARIRPGRVLLPAEVPLAAPAIDPNLQRAFLDAVNAGLDPMACDQFWIEGGSMSSGGSHSQLELPRGGNRFFGFDFNLYGREHVTIGYPSITLRGRRWADRPLTWHGDNRMERINLPTLAQGGFEYRNTAVLFRRHGDGFEIDVLPWDDPGAIAWRAASAALGKTFRLGSRGVRICGLF